MRVVAGKYRHRIIKMTQLETTRETQDKVRGAIFNMIGPYFDGGSALDLFAGSGAMGIEAVSRGIEEVCFNDIEPKAIAIAKENCQSLGIQQAHFFNMDYASFLRSTQQKWNIIFLDPPYKMTEVCDILAAVLPCLLEKGRVIFELARETAYPTELEGLVLLKNKEYGIKRVLVYELKGGI